MDTEQRKEYSTEVHNQIIGWTENCDTKASIILAFVGVLVSIAFTSEYLLSGIETEIKNIISYWDVGIGGFSFLSTLMFLSLIGFVIFIVLSCHYAITALKANIKSPNNSIIFFGKIAETTKEVFVSKVSCITEEEYEDDKLTQIHACATICNNKFKKYNESIKYLRLGLVLFICFVSFVVLLKSM